MELLERLSSPYGESGSTGGLGPDQCFTGFSKFDGLRGCPFGHGTMNVEGNAHSENQVGC